MDASDYAAGTSITSASASPPSPWSCSTSTISMHKTITSSRMQHQLLRNSSTKATTAKRRKTVPPVRTITTTTTLSPSPSPSASNASAQEGGERKESSDHRPRVLVISGPTAVGKTSVALQLARVLDGEIISADSVQVYKGLDVGSAKTPLPDRKGVPHHMIDIVHPVDDYSVGDYFAQSREATEQVLKRGKVPILVGGTGMYLRWYLYGAPDTPKSTPEGQALAEEELSKAGGDWDKSVQLLFEAGDTGAMGLKRNDWYRLRRSFEIVKARGGPRTGAGCLYYTGGAGKSSSSNDDADDCPKRQPAGAADLDYDFVCLFLYNPRETLYRFIDERCEDMLAGNFGLLKEASWLLDLGIMPNTSPASRAIGYRQAMEYLLRCRKDSKAICPEELLSFLSDFQKASRNYAKRQLTWFRQEPLYFWINAAKPTGDIVSFVSDLYMKRDFTTGEANDILIRKETTVDKKNQLRNYKAKRRHFVRDSDCSDVLEWVRETQAGKGEEFESSFPSLNNQSINQMGGDFFYC